MQPNYDFRTSSTNPEEVRAVRDAFARSVLWGFAVAAETSGRVLVDVLERLVDAASAKASRRRSPYEAEIARAVERVLVERLMGLAGGAPMPQVRALTSDALQALVRSPASASGGRLEAAHEALLAQDIRRFLERPAPAQASPSIPVAPPGAPIGEPALDYLRSLEPYCP